ncbi:MAG: ABC transporter substrate-binding protein [Candidatus Electrothrix sp. AR4]|nr:ABC transporter substrate-binding protein [Candidatus Electrothrix sp. AR4]
MAFVKFFRRHWRIFLIEAILFSITFSAICMLRSKADKVHVGVMLSRNSNSEAIKNALDLYAERINKYGGIKSKDRDEHIYGKTLNFEYVQNSLEEAEEIAQKLVKQEHTAAIIDSSSQQAILAAESAFYAFLRLYL